MSGMSSREDWRELITAFRARAAQANQAGPPSLPLYVGDTQIGELEASLAPKLQELGPSVFEVDDVAVRLSKELVAASVDERTAAVATVTAALKDAGLVKGWRDEMLNLATAFGSPPMLYIERACLPMFGGKGYGIFVNGWSKDPNTGEPFLWVATRSKTKPTWPGMLDVLAGGSVAAGESPSESVVKESAEEAGVPLELARGARPVGCCSRRGVDERGYLKRDVYFCYDLELPWDFEPVVVDGEVESFQRLPFSAVADAVAYGLPKDQSASGPKVFRPSCNLVIIDLLIRHGYLPAEAPGYPKLVAELRQGDCT